MKMLAFAKRCAKEVLRDPITLIFGAGMPIVLLLLLTAINSNVPEEANMELFDLKHLTPGVSVFALSFLTLVSALTVARDRSSSLLCRLYTTPLRPVDFILGYTLPLVPTALLQCAVCYVTAIILGLPLSVNILWAVLFILPCAAFFIPIGLLAGSVFNEKQVGTVCGALLSNLCGWLSGTWFDLKLVGGAFEKAASFLPFAHAVEIERAVLAGDLAGIFPHLWWVLGYAAAASVGAVLLFMRQMKRQ